MALTVRQAKDSRIKRISGVCPDSVEFLQYLNDAERELLRLGNWWNSLSVMRGCIYNECLVWPRQVATVLAFENCNGSAPPKNQWAEFNAVLPEHVAYWNQFNTFPCQPNIALVDHGTTPVVNQIPCLNDRYLQFYIVEPTDAGKTITVFGIDGNGQEIITTRADGTIQPGVVLTLVVPFVQTPMLIRRVDRILKDVTVKPVYAYQFDGSNRFFLSTYEPGETNPYYRQSKLVGAVCQDCCWPKQISAFVKLDHVELVHDDDALVLDNIDALALMIQSLKLSDAFDSGGAEGMKMRAVRTLNNDLRNRLPIDSTPVRVQPFGTARLERVNLQMQ